MKKRTTVDVHNLSVRFGDFYAVRDVSFSVLGGEIFGFLGANGAGKTTTIRVLCGLLPASSGHVEIDGIVADNKNLNEIKRRVGYMSQRFTLYDGLSVGENFDFAAALRQMPRDEYIRRRRVLLEFIGFDKKLSTIVKNLPGGIKQEVALGVCLLHDPSIIFLDEPTAGVAPVARLRFWKLIRKLAADGKTVFVTTHYMDEAENCTRIALMRAGCVVAIGAPSELKQQTFPDALYNITPRVKNPKMPPKNIFDLFEPYGRHFHVRFKSGIKIPTAIRKYMGDFDVEKIDPSLEDVFMQIVEGGAR